MIDAHIATKTTINNSYDSLESHNHRSVAGMKAATSVSPKNEAIVSHINSRTISTSTPIRSQALIFLRFVWSIMCEF